MLDALMLGALPSSWMLCLSRWMPWCPSCWALCPHAGCPDAPHAGNFNKGVARVLCASDIAGRKEGWKEEREACKEQHGAGRRGPLACSDVLMLRQRAL
eukprot:1161120-Pelagomonas_calceolata.AAC.3